MVGWTRVVDDYAARHNGGSRACNASASRQRPDVRRQKAQESHALNACLPARPDRVFSGVLAATVVFASLTACSVSSDATKQEHFSRAEQYFVDKKYDEAIVEYRTALQQDPKFAEARFKLAEAYVAKHDY